MSRKTKPFTKDILGGDIPRIGETTRRNHADCPAGIDTRKRLYITRPANTPDMVLVYCHNCQQGTAFNIKELGGFATSSFRTITSRDVKGEKPIHFSVPKSLTTDKDLWPVEARAWAYKRGLDQKVTTYSGIAYAATEHAIYLPMHREQTLCPGWTWAGATLGYQLRLLNENAGSKYLTSLFSKHAQVYTKLSWHKNEEPDICILVEDFVSGVKLINTLARTHPHLTVQALVNYGVQVKLEALAGTNAKINVVWLDNDNEHVRIQADTIVRTWNMLSPSPVVKVEVPDLDPKYATKSELTRIIDTLNDREYRS